MGGEGDKRTTMDWRDQRGGSQRGERESQLQRFLQQACFASMPSGAGDDCHVLFGNPFHVQGSGINCGCVSRPCMGVNWYAGGVHWAYGFMD